MVHINDNPFFIMAFVSFILGVINDIGATALFDPKSKKNDVSAFCSTISFVLFVAAVVFALVWLILVNS